MKIKRVKLGLIGPSLLDTYKHQCNRECEGNIHVIYREVR
jgi:hypothetical protein